MSEALQNVRSAYTRPARDPPAPVQKDTAPEGYRQRVKRCIDEFNKNQRRKK